MKDRRQRRGYGIPPERLRSREKLEKDDTQGEDVRARVDAFGLICSGAI